jgi:transposase
VIPIASGVRVWIATGHTDMRRGMNSLGLLVQEAFKRDPHGGDLYVFRGNDRDRGTSRDATPPTPPGIRVRTAAVRLS